MALEHVLVRHALEAETWTPPQGVDARTTGAVVGAFLDTALTSLGRATTYNARAEQQSAELAVHEAMLRLDRGLYATLLAVPGVADRARQVAVCKLLGSAVADRDGAVERSLVAGLLDALP